MPLPMPDTDPTDVGPEDQDPESSAAADAPEPEEGGERQEGPPTDKLDEDPAYEPDDTGLKGLKGG